jgi:ABC-type nitrate/sulfonate/bicarbonate transport system ATPase subunit
MRLTNLQKAYGDRKVLCGLSLEIPDGGITCILGKSGVGKTTLLNLLAGVTDFLGEVVPKVESVGYVFQENRLLSHLTVEENLQFVGGRCEVIDELLRSAGIENLRKRKAATLSGGEKRRVALLRAFCVDAPLVLLDEPFSALDSVTKESLLFLLKERLQKSGQTAVFVTHDVDEAVAVADKIAVMENGKIAWELTLAHSEMPRAYGALSAEREAVMAALRSSEKFGTEI